eukprot:4316363-Pyramimonas_sp.AAC.1
MAAGRSAAKSASVSGARSRTRGCPQRQAGDPHSWTRRYQARVSVLAGPSSSMHRSSSGVMTTQSVGRTADTATTSRP